MRVAMTASSTRDEMEYDKDLIVKKQLPGELCNCFL
ncbi:MAG: hypothetical protein K0Q77_2022 [Anaerosporomusa subterranea]|jgi:hypothetical protein|nr:hypothetical protein [Anaerosporomusa subterranea]